MTEPAAAPMCSLRFAHQDGAVLIWPDGAAPPDADWFEPERLAARGSLASAGTGRGDAQRFEAGDGRTLVLRHYRRGGQMQRLSEDKYLRVGLRQSRPWRELALLTRMAAGGMPVPPPVAARVQPVSPLSPWYRGDLVTEYLPGTRTLTQRLREGAGIDWASIGMTIAQFHSVGLDHADLNAQNLLLDEAGDVYLIDFDRARLRWPGRWRAGNLARLRRSLEKVQAADPDVPFGSGQWQRLMAGYHSA